MGDALLQKKFTTDTLPFRKKRNRGEMPQYYVENSNPPIVSKEVYQAAQELQKSRNVSHKRESDYPLTGVLHCPECGRTFRRLLLNDTAYWLCSGKAAGATDCQSRRVRENAVYDTFCLMADKLASHQQDLLGTLIHQLEMMQNRGGENQERIRQIDKQIADLSAQNLVVARLHTNGVLNVRMLKEIGVDIFFEEQNIHSTQPGAEFYITMNDTKAMPSSIKPTLWIV